jgi:uncharacterized protein (DUF885 family)
MWVDGLHILSRVVFVHGSTAATLAGCATTGRDSARSDGPAAQARAAYDSIFEQVLAASPETATQLGLDTGARAGLKRLLSDPGPAGRLGQYRPIVDALPRLRAIDATRLAGRERGWLATAIWYGERGAEFDTIPWGHARGYPAPYILSQLTGSYQGLPDFLDTQHRIENAADASAYLDRLDAFHRAVDSEVEAARADAGRGVIPPAFIIDKARAQTRTLLGEKGIDSGLVRSLVRRTREKGITGDWEGRAARIVDGPLAAALARQAELLDGWRKRADDAPGVARLPDGERFYAQALRYHTSTRMDPAAIHQLGLDQIAALNQEAEPLLRAAGLTHGSVGARITALSERPENLFANDDAGRAKLLAYLREHMAMMRSRMPELFSTLPTSPMEPRRVPPSIEVGSPGAYAQSGDLAGTRPGIFYINLANTAARPRFALPTLSCHEAIPGHLWQGAIVNSARDIPLLHRALGIPAFAEGYGLYSVTLGDELGIYRDDPLGPPGRRHRHPRDGLEPRACDRLLHAGGRPRAGQRRARDRPLHRLAGPGVQLQDRPQRDAPHPRRHAAPARPPLRHQGLSRSAAAQRRHAARGAGADGARLGRIAHGLIAWPCGRAVRQTGGAGLVHLVNWHRNPKARSVTRGRAHTAGANRCR